MLKSTITTALLLAVQITGYSQWEEKNIPTNSTLTCVDFASENIGFVTGGNKIYKTENGGDTWATSYTASDLVIYEDIFVIDDETIIAVGKDLDSNQSAITKTENGGTDWAEATISNPSFLRSVFFISPEVGFCSGGGGTILKSINGGDSWQALNTGTDLNLQSIFFVNEMVGIAVGGFPSSAVILKTQDGGFNWNPINSPSNNNLQSVYFSNQDTGYIVGWNGEIMRTEDCGGNWTIQSSVAMTGNLEVTFTDDQTGYIVGGSLNEPLIQKTTNGGDLWEDISPQIPAGLVCIQFPSFNVGYAVGENGTIVKTESGGVMTNTNNLEFSDQFRAFPNPTNGTLNIESEYSNRIDRLRIYDSNGRAIKEYKLNSFNVQTDLSDLEPNVYYLEIISKKKKEIKKIVKKN
ncbi:MAG: YCF48-related protein [Bacteroidota bacterium]